MPQLTEAQKRKIEEQVLNGFASEPTPGPAPKQSAWVGVSPTPLPTADDVYARQRKVYEDIEKQRLERLQRGGEPLPAHMSKQQPSSWEPVDPYNNAGSVLSGQGRVNK